MLKNAAMVNEMGTNNLANLVFSYWRLKTSLTKLIFPRGKPFEIESNNVKHLLHFQFGGVSSHNIYNFNWDGWKVAVDGYCDNNI
jgi:hypothetical protein